MVARKRGPTKFMPMSLYQEEEVCYKNLSHIPNELRIRVVYVDSSIVVIVKPNNLRSVPGFASSSSYSSSSSSSDQRKNNIQERRPDEEPSASRTDDNENDSDSENGEPPTQRRASQEAWVLAIQSFAQNDGDTSSECGRYDDHPDKKATLLLQHLASQPASHVQSIPRKYSLFHRYLKKNAQKLQLSRVEKDRLEMDGTFQKMFDRLRAKQLDWINIPEVTRPEESAVGQLSLLLQGKRPCPDTPMPMPPPATQASNLHVVHRLDCETSGLMVFARTKAAAQALSRAWRERQVTKVYVALVHNWPPLAADGPDGNKENPQKGRIDLPLRASSTERIKWQVDELHGKPSTTLWTVLHAETKDAPAAIATYTEGTPVRLELVPITGRTHQLRVHCAAVGGGIIGDSLYGRSAHASLEASSSPRTSTPISTTLELHAQRLCFPHPLDGRPMEFLVDPTW